MVRKQEPRKPRDPSWRLRRALGQKRKESAKVYRRPEDRLSERAARTDAEPTGPENNGPENNGPENNGAENNGTEDR